MSYGRIGNDATVTDANSKRLCKKVTDKTVEHHLQ